MVQQVALGLGRVVLAAGGAAALLSTQVTQGLLHEWHFDEGTGTTVSDKVGDTDITFDATFQSSFSSDPTWTDKGLLLEGDMVRTDSGLEGVQTTAMLYRTPQHSNTNAFISAFPAANSGILGRQLDAADDAYILQGASVAPILRRASDGQHALKMDAPGYKIVFQQWDSGQDSVWGWGGRFNGTANRVTEMELAWAAAWDDKLTPAEMEQVARYVRLNHAVPRGIYCHPDDCPYQAVAVWLAGQSNAQGRGLTSDLASSKLDARDKVHILAGAGGTSTSGTVDYADYDHGTNPNETQVGPDLPLIDLHQAARDDHLFVAKATAGGSRLAKGDVVPATAGDTWNADEDIALPVERAYGSLQQWWHMTGRALDRGIGLHLGVLAFAQGEEDQVNTAFGSIYEDNLNDLLDFWELYGGWPSSVPIALTRAGEVDPIADATATAQVRAAQAAVAAARGNVTLIDSDDYARLVGDAVHYSTAGQIDHADDIYAVASFPAEDGNVIDGVAAFADAADQAAVVSAGYWTLNQPANSDAVIDRGEMTVTRGTGRTEQRKQLTLVSGTTYRVTLYVAEKTGTGTVSVWLGSTVNNASDLDSGSLATGIYTATFTPAQASAWLNIAVNGAEGDTVRFGALRIEPV